LVDEIHYFIGDIAVVFRRMRYLTQELDETDVEVEHLGQFLVGVSFVGKPVVKMSSMASMTLLLLLLLPLRLAALAFGIDLRHVGAGLLSDGLDLERGGSDAILIRPVMEDRVPKAQGIAAVIKRHDT